MTALLEYLDLFQIQGAETWCNQCWTLSPWALALLTTAIETLLYVVVMLSIVVIFE